MRKRFNLLTAGDFDDIRDLLHPLVQNYPFSLVVRDVIMEAVKRISKLESERGDIARTERSALAPAAQPYQDLIDWLLFKMAGLTDHEAAGLEDRLGKML